MDYLKRDSFFTGVVEGNIGTDRLIKMLDVRNDMLTIEAKGIYSVEKFLIARRLMYWQVYFHKTVIASENMLVKTLQRARFLAQSGEKLFATPPLEYFLYNSITTSKLEEDPAVVISYFLDLDDSDIMVSAKQWAKHDDKVLRILSDGIINRKLLKVQISKQEYNKSLLDSIISKVQQKEMISLSDASFLVSSDTIKNRAYTDKTETILISFSDGSVKEIAEVSDVLNISYLNELVKKYYLCYPKGCAE
jgi:HD superfamily phosphohydrolase